MTAILRVLSRRLLTSLIVLIGVSMLIFAIARVIPGNPARIALGPNATAEQIEKLSAALHLDAPIWVQYGYFLRDLSRGDPGISLYTNRPVTTDIAQFLPATLELVLVAGFLMVAIGLPLGILSARYRGGSIDNAVRVFAMLTVSAPGFVWAVILMPIFTFYLPIFPIAGRISDTYSIPAVTGLSDHRHASRGQPAGLREHRLAYIVLQAFALALSGIGQAATAVCLQSESD